MALVGLFEGHGGCNKAVMAVTGCLWWRPLFLTHPFSRSKFLIYLDISCRVPNDKWSSVQHVSNLRPRVGDQKKKSAVVANSSSHCPGGSTGDNPAAYSKTVCHFNY